MPTEAIGKRVVVELANGTVCGRLPVNPDTAPGWAAGTTRWSLTGEPFDVARFEVL